MCVRAVYVWCVRGAGETRERGRIWTEGDQAPEGILCFSASLLLSSSPKRLTLNANSSTQTGLHACTSLLGQPRPRTKAVIARRAALSWSQDRIRNLPTLTHQKPTLPPNPHNRSSRMGPPPPPSSSPPPPSLTSSSSDAATLVQEKLDRLALATFNAVLEVSRAGQGQTNEDGHRGSTVGQLKANA